MNISVRIPVNGTVAESNLPPERPDDTSWGVIGGECGGKRYELSVNDLLRKNLFLEGSPRSGKSNCINLVLTEVLPRLEENDVAIVFDARGNYCHDFYDEARGDVLLSTLERHKNMTAKWNIFAEVESLPEGSGQRDLLIREMAEYIVQSKGTQHDFFVDGARNLVAGVIDNGLRQKEKGIIPLGITLSNRMLWQALNSPIISNPTARIERHPLLYFDKSSEYAYLNDYFSPSSTWKAPMDFRAFARHAATNTFFGAAFGAENGNFSVKEFVRNRGGRCLFLEYDTNHNKIIDRVYSLILDLMMKDVLSNDEHPGAVYIILDELSLVKSEIIPLVVNFGGGQGVRTIVATQSHSSMFSKYGEDEANAILSGFGAYAFFSLGDPVSRTWLKDHFGKSDIRNIRTSGYTIKSGIVSDYVVSDPVLNGLRVGEAVVSLPEEQSGKAACPPFVFRFDKYS